MELLNERKRNAIKAMLRNKDGLGDGTGRFDDDVLDLTGLFCSALRLDKLKEVCRGYLPLWTRRTPTREAQNMEECDTATM